MINLKIREVDKNTVYSDRGFDLNPSTLVEISITDQDGRSIKIKPSRGSFLIYSNDRISIAPRSSHEIVLVME